MKMLGSYRYYEFGRTIGINGVYRESSGPFETHNGSTTVQTGFGHWRHADGTGWYDNAARIYDAVLLRFLTPDPLWRRYLDTAPYTYCLANPLRYLDRDGAQNDLLEEMAAGPLWRSNQPIRFPNQLNRPLFVAGSFQPAELPDRNAEIPDSEHEIQINAPQDEQIGQMLHAANVINTSLGVENGVKEAFIKYAVKGTETGREFGIYMKCLKHMGRITMFGGIAIAGCNAWNYYEMGGRSPFVYGKFYMDAMISCLSNLGWHGIIVGGVYLILDEATDGFWIDYSVPTQQQALTDD